MTDLCREYGISRKTGYKLFNRYKEHGCVGRTDRSRRPLRRARVPIVKASDVALDLEPGFKVDHSAVRSQGEP